MVTEPSAGQTGLSCQICQAGQTDSGLGEQTGLSAGQAIYTGTGLSAGQAR